MAAVKTIRITAPDGGFFTINASAFDEKVHTAFVEASAPPATPVATPAAPAAGPSRAEVFVNRPAADVVADLDGVDEVPFLAELKDIEAAGKNRKTVLMAIEQRLHPPAPVKPVDQ